MRGNVPDLDLPTPAEMRDTDGVDLTDQNHKLTQTHTHTQNTLTDLMMSSDAFTTKPNV